MRRMEALFLVVIMMLVSVFAPIAQAETQVTLEDVNRFLNESAKLGAGSKANPVAVIEVDHIDGPKEEDLFYAFVTFKYEARNYIKYQVSYISCTCRSADVNLWTTAYLELTKPESGLLDDAVLRTLSFGKDSTGHYDAGFWGDSNPIPTGGQTFELINEQFIPYLVDKTYGQLKNISTIADIDLAEYQAGEGRGEYTIDTWTGATVSTNNTLRMVQAMMEHHGTDPFFANDSSLVKGEAAAQVKADGANEEAKAEAGTQVLAALPAPVDTAKTYKANKDDTVEVPCTPGSFGPTCSAINASNLLEYYGRPDVMYIDTRDFGDYMKKHIRNFEVIPFFALIFNAEAHMDASLPQLYGGSPAEPVPVYEESDQILEALFPKDKILFIMCQSGGRVGMLMNIMAARGWDMSKVYNVGGMAQYTGPEYKDLITDTPELVLSGTYSIEGLTRIAP